jgi:hypothetical protein
MPVFFTTFVAASLALAGLASAQITSPESRDHIRNHPTRPQVLERRVEHPRRNSQDCPSGDCRGVNSAGGLGGTSSDF